ncbi:DMT family transporter [Albidovulum sediminicola]|uniref:DMT family transporter n=1 Tax=Albidovulum sediminicola TaxID=2984331 RepID=A0ABT2YZM4_9RHOB|nr:DMT family transporter [Defluviimonas sp. WL0075]MCV2864306.1 DMT family transporter [Defluviimonas sp. WL0075]
MGDVHRPFLAALWMMGSVAGFSLIAVSGRQIGTALNPPEMMLYRSLIGVALVVAYALLSGRLAEIRAERLGFHLLRNVIHFAGQNLWLYALALIPLAQLFAVEFSSPLMVALAAPLLLGERMTATKAVSAAVGFTGILIVARPFSEGGLGPGILLALASALAFAGTAIVTKRLTRRVTVVGILFWLTVMQSGLAAAVAGWDGAIALPGPVELPWVAAMGIGGIVAHMGLTKALTLAPATIVVPVDFLRLPVIAVIGMLAYGEPMDLWVFLGGAIIFCANWLNLSAGTARAVASGKV